MLRVLGESRQEGRLDLRREKRSQNDATGALEVVCGLLAGVPPAREEEEVCVSWIKKT